MPNWVDNNIKITGSKENLKKFAERITETMETENYSEEGFPVTSYVRICESFYPQPKELSLINEGRNSNNDLYWWVLDENENKVSTSLFDEDQKITTTKNITIEEMFDLILKYNSFNWYDWRHMYWGSKSGDLYTQMNIQDDYIEIYCESAWNPLGRLFDGISNELDLKVEINWFEEGGYYGTIVIENGVLIKNDKDWKDIYNIDYIANQEENTNEEE